MFEDLVSLENLCAVWEEFIKGKRNKKDVQVFESNLMENIIDLHESLKNQTYNHDRYTHFKINDPKPRDIHKASVRDRLLHHAIHRQLYPIFDRIFIADSFSCRKSKGLHRALNRFTTFARKVNHNNTKTCWILKCDIKKFFASIDHETLLNLLSKRITDGQILNLLGKVIKSFEHKPGKGLPLGNLTSQLFANIYLNELDQHIKHYLRIKHYIRYADDFVILSADQTKLKQVLKEIDGFLLNELDLQLHPNKVFIKTLASGADFLGWVNFPHFRVLRTKTKRRIERGIRQAPGNDRFQSYLGLLQHGNAYKINNQLKNDYWLWKD